MFFLLALFGIAVGMSLVLLPFPANCAVPYALILLVLSVVRPWVVILFLLGMTPLRILWLAGGISPVELLYSLSFLWLLGISILRQFFRKPVAAPAAWRTPVVGVVWGMMGVGVWGALVGILRGHPFSHWTSDLNFILFFGLYFVVTVNVKDSRDLWKVLWLSMWVTAGVILWGIYRRISEGTVFYGIAPGFPRGMAFGSTFFILFTCLLLFSKGGSLKRTGLFFLTLFFGLHQILSFVRAIWIAQIAAVGFILMVLPFSEKHRLLRGLGAVCVLLSLLLSLFSVLPTENQVVKMSIHVMHRFLSIFIDVGGRGATMQTRYSEWTAALRKFSEHPLIGNGLGTEIQFIRYDYASLPLTTERYIHSSYIYYLLNTGPLGLLIFLWFCICCVTYGLRVYRALSDPELKGLSLGMTASVVFQIFASIAGSELSNPARTIWTGFFLGALAVIDREAKRMKEKA